MLLGLSSAYRYTSILIDIQWIEQVAAGTKTGPEVLKNLDRISVSTR